MKTPEIIRIIPRPQDYLEGDDPPPRREWLVTNGLGGYASGTVAGVVTRRYQGLLISSLPAPLGRFVMLNHLLERVRLPNHHVVWLGDEGAVAAPNIADRADHLAEFRLELGLPVWRYELPGVVIEKRLLMPYGQNTVHVTYRLLEGTEPVRLALRPSIQFRGYEAPVDTSLAHSYTPDLLRRPIRGHSRPGRSAVAAAGVRRACGVDARREGRGGDSLRNGALPRLPIRRLALQPGVLPRRPAPRQRRDAGRFHRVVGNHPRAVASRRGRGRARTPPAADFDRRTRRGGSARRGARPGSRPVHHHAGRPGGGAARAHGPRARRSAP